MAEKTSWGLGGGTNLSRSSTAHVKRKETRWRTHTKGLYACMQACKRGHVMAHACAWWGGGVSLLCLAKAVRCVQGSGLQLITSLARIFPSELVRFGVGHAGQH